VRVTRDGGINAIESTDGLLLYYAKAPHSPTAIWRVRVAGGKEDKVIDGLSYSLNLRSRTRVFTSSLWVIAKRKLPLNFSTSTQPSGSAFAD
jgi:hypothetical protein